MVLHSHATTNLQTDRGADEIKQQFHVTEGAPLSSRYSRRIHPFLNRFLCSLLRLATVVVLGRVAPAAELSFFHRQVFSTEDGLPQASVHALLESHDGYLWVGTEGGAARFDGLDFRVFDHTTSSCFTQDDVSAIAEDDYRNIWIGTSDGLVSLRDESCKRYTTEQGLPSNNILSLARSRYGMTVLTAGGIVSQAGNYSRFFVQRNDVVAIARSQDGKLLLSLRSGNLLEEGDKTVRILASKKEDQPSPLGVAIGPGLEPWFFDQNALYAGTGRRQQIWRLGADLPGSRIQVLSVDPEGTAWVGTNRGLASVRLAWPHKVSVIKELQGESILSLLRDRDGDLWVGTEASGLNAFHRRRFAAEPALQQQSISAVVRGGDGAMYLGTLSDGVFRIQHGSEAVAAGRLTSPVVLSLAAGVRGDLWIGTPDGLNELVSGRVRQWTIANGLPDNFIRALYAQKNGTVWAGTRFGLVRAKRGAVRTFSHADGLLSDSIGALAETPSTEMDGSVLWAGTAAGLCRLQGDRFVCLQSPETTQSAVTALGTDEQGRLWVALHGHGLALAAGDRLLPLRSDSLPQEIVGLLADANGSLWLRSQRGLYRVQEEDAQRCAHEEGACSGLGIDHYDRADGMQSEELALPASPVLATSATGELWVSTRRGIAITDAHHLQAEQIPPGLVITSARTDEVEFPLTGSARLSPDHRQYSINYVGLALNNPARTRYRYRLEGLDRDWVQAGARRTAYFTKLAPGGYVFHVQCVNGQGVRSKEVTLRFIVMKPWYRRWWAYVTGSGAILLALLALVRGRVLAERRRLTLVLQERSRVAREVHDTLAQDLVSVSLQLEITTQHAKAGRLTETTEGIAQAKGLVRQALDSARQSIWDLRANLAKSSLPAHLAIRVNQTRERGISVRLRIGGEYRQAPVATEGEVLRVASEAMSNIEKHSRATEVSVDLLYAAAAMQLTIRDNGCGFNPAEARALAGHYGLRGLEERAIALEGELRLVSEPGGGTTITLDAPLPRTKR